jgi:phosphoserine phosphatase RsbU/P
MTSLVVLVETVVLVALVWSLARRAESAEATRARIAAIAALLAAQALVLDGFVLRVLPGLWRAGHGLPPGMVWLTQAARTALLVSAFVLWCRVSHAAIRGPRRGGLLIAALLALAFGGGVLPVLALGALLWISGRSPWTRELSGWRRLTTLFVAPSLLLLTTLAPAVVVTQGRLETVFAVLRDPWQPALISGVASGPLRLEQALARPLDRVVQALLDLFRAQLLVATLRALTLPMRLYGTSLKRRFIVNYIFVRSIPSVLAFLTLLVVGYVAFGVYETGRARSEFERSLARAQAASVALLERTRNARPSEIVSMLEAARAWLTPDGAHAHFVLRRPNASAGREAVTTATSGTPLGLLQLSGQAAPGGRLEGLVEDGSALFLVARRVEADSSHALDVFVPLDSTYLGSVAKRIGAHITLTLDRGFSTGPAQVSFRGDTTARRVRVASLGPASARANGFFLGRSYLPLGDWSVGWREGAEGAVALELRATRAMLVASAASVPGWLFSNVIMLALLLVLTALIGTVEGLAVRSGRGIVRSIEEEVAALQEAVTRFGAGELGHRIPVRGRDEFSMLAGSFNTMAANLERQRGELIEKERLEEDLEVARSIQRRFLPQQSPSVPGLEVAGVSVPSQEVGGDLFHYAELPGGRLVVALGDVSGKSVPAALIMSNVMSALRAETQHEQEIEKSLGRINRLMVDQVETGRFVTLFYGIVDPQASLLHYTSAGHNPVLHVSASGEVSWLREGGVPLGVAESPEYPSARVPMEPGDLLVAYSDGVTEAEGPGKNRELCLFGEERLAGVVSASRSEPVEAILAGLLQALKRFSEGRPQADDLTVVIVRRT